MQPEPRFCIPLIQDMTRLLSDWLVCEIAYDDCDVPFHHKAADSPSWLLADRDLDEVYRLGMALLSGGSQTRQNHKKSTKPKKINKFHVFDHSVSDTSERSTATFSFQYRYVIKRTGDEIKRNSQAGDRVVTVSVFHNIVNFVRKSCE